MSSRNLLPHAEARMAMIIWQHEYAYEQSGGSMDFWDSRTAAQKRQCVDLVNEIRQADAYAKDSPQVLLGGNHPDDFAVDRFAAAMKAKLAVKRGVGFSGWDDPEQCHIDHLVNLLVDQITGRAVLDPVDIGNLAMMIHNRPETPSHGR